MANVVSPHQSRSLAYVLLVTVILLGAGCVATSVEYDGTSEGTTLEDKVVVRCKMNPIKNTCGRIRNKDTGKVHNLIEVDERDSRFFRPMTIETVYLDSGVYVFETPWAYFNNISLESGHSYEVSFDHSHRGIFWFYEHIICVWIQDTTTGDFLEGYSRIIDVYGNRQPGPEVPCD